VPLRIKWLLKTLKGQKSPTFYQITTDFIKAGRRKIHSEIHKFIKLFGKRGFA